MTTANLGSYRVELEVPIAASRDHVWKCLTNEIGEWWPREYFVTKAPSFRLDARLGGYLYEDGDGDSGAIWFQIIMLVPGESMNLQGHIAPPFGGPCTSLVSIRLEERGDHCTFRLTDDLFGVMPKDPTCMDSGWDEIFKNRLKRYAEE